MMPSLPACRANDTGVPEIEETPSANDLLDRPHNRHLRIGSSDVMHDDMKIMYPKECALIGSVIYTIGDVLMICMGEKS